MGRILDGKAVARAVRAEVGQRVDLYRAAHGTPPGLAAVLVGDDPASRIYVNNKEKACAEVGIRSGGRRLPTTTTTDELLDVVAELNAQADVHGILVQLLRNRIGRRTT